MIIMLVVVVTICASCCNVKELRCISHCSSK